MLQYLHVRSGATKAVKVHCRRPQRLGRAHRRRQEPAAVTASRERAGYSVPGADLWPWGHSRAHLSLSAFPEISECIFASDTLAPALTQRPPLTRSSVPSAPGGSLRGLLWLLSSLRPLQTPSMRPIPTHQPLDATHLVSVPSGPADVPACLSHLHGQSADLWICHSAARQFPGVGR